VAHKRARAPKMFHRVPPELERTIPRDVELTGQGVAVLVIAVLIAMTAIVGGSVLAILAQRGTAIHDQEVREGVAAAAEITEVGRTRGKDRRTYATYRFSVDGKVFGGRTVFANRDERNLVVGQPIEIRYLPSNPKRSWVEGYEFRAVPLWLAPALGLFGIGLSLFLIHQVGHERRMLAERRATLARVLESKKSAVGDQYRVKYEYSLLSGAQRTGSLSLPKQPMAEGAQFVVLYDADAPERHVRYPRELVRVVRSF